MKASKLHEVWSVKDDVNSINITVLPNYTFSIFRIRVKDEAFVKKAIQEVAEKIIQIT